ncbi:SRPBCC family protein [Paenibacillus glycanilyticus]|uniref:ATPase n=1 Tax=Paenibacillus glycanilyticus TaxID=126569 RepID=A0ABQ6G8W1_9BACL|nr:SRPBCC family protein [Paenibacillus glycanilyticus]GLX65726.1 ATPase [Paenibacillus glycanilyticus]
MTETTFVYTIYIATTPEKLWEALTSSAYTAKYFFGSSIQSDWKEGSSISYSRNEEVTDYGVILKSEPYRTLSFTWTYAADKTVRDEPQKVTFELTPLDSTMKLKLKHEGLAPADLVEKEDTFEGINNGWPAILSNLKSLLETGTTLRAITI